jgi:DNA uptake protein ComE-like DNA-binding protein
LFAPENGKSARNRIRGRISEWSDILSQKLDRTKDAIAKHADGFSTGSSRADDSQVRQEQSQNRSLKKKPGGSGNPTDSDLINTISKDELLRVHGIGPVLADRIISGRPYASRLELIERRVLSQNTFEELERELGRRNRRSA